MLIPMPVFHTAQNMDLTRIDEALKSNGYPDGANDLTSSRFLGMNTDGMFVYQITFKDPDAVNGIGTGNIYVEIASNELNNDFWFIADY